MILCDGGCQRAYHLECIHLTEVPDDDWLCPSCIRYRNAKKGSTRPQKNVEEESDEYFETKKEKREKIKSMKKKKVKDNDETFQISRKPNNRQALVDRDYSGMEGKLIPCPIEGCGARASTRTSLLSHAYILLIEGLFCRRSNHTQEYVKIAKILGCN